MFRVLYLTEDGQDAPEELEDVRGVVGLAVVLQYDRQDHRESLDLLGARGLKLRKL